MARALPLLLVLLCSGAAHAQDYRFPIRLPASGTQPYITAHRDNNTGAALDDYTCGNDTYNGHQGTDIGIGGFDVFDAGSRVVVAAAPGRVAGVRDGCFDRCTTGSCDCADGFGNYVRIDHDDGKRTYYGHLKKNSLLVSLGDEVTCGTALGKVGSSGNSTGPHLHFEVRHSNNTADDPYRGDCSGPVSYWVTQGAYGGLPDDVCEGGEPPAPTTGTVRGAVFEDQGVGTADMSIRITGATVSLVGTATTTTATGDTADWTLTANAGDVVVRATAPGHQPNERTCTVTSGETTWCSIGLFPTVVTPPDAGAPPDAAAPSDAAVEAPPDAGAVEPEVDAGETLDAAEPADASEPPDATTRDASAPSSPDGAVTIPKEDAGTLTTDPDAGAAAESDDAPTEEADATPASCATAPSLPWVVAAGFFIGRKRKRSA